MAFISATTSAEAGGSGRRTPLGFPVVPEVYVMGAPAARFSGLLVGWPLFSASKVPSAVLKTASSSAILAASFATCVVRGEQKSALESESLRM
jgi:hypothetical protein